jgi:hypothetical protein
MDKHLIEEGLEVERLINLIGSNNYDYYLQQEIELQDNPEALEILRSLMPLDPNNLQIGGIPINKGIESSIKSRRDSPYKDFGELAPHPFFHLPLEVQFLIANSSLLLEPHRGCTLACYFCDFVSREAKGKILERMDPNTAMSIINEFCNLSQQEIPADLEAILNEGYTIRPMDSMYGNTDISDIVGTIEVDGELKEVDIVDYMKMLVQLGRMHNISSACGIGQEITVIRAIEFIMNNPDVKMLMRLSRNKVNYSRIEKIMEFLEAKHGRKAVEELMEERMHSISIPPVIYPLLGIEDRLDGESVVPVGKMLAKSITNGESIDLCHVAINPSCADGLFITTEGSGLRGLFNVPECELFSAGVAQYYVDVNASQIVIPVCKMSSSQKGVIGITTPEVFIHDKVSGRTSRETLENCQVNDSQLQEFLDFVDKSRRLSRVISTFVAYNSCDVSEEEYTFRMDSIYKELLVLKSEEILDQDLVLRYVLEKLPQRVKYLRDNGREAYRNIEDENNPFIIVGPDNQITVPETPFVM